MQAGLRTWNCVTVILENLLRSEWIPSTHGRPSYVHKGIVRINLFFSSLQNMLYAARCQTRNYYFDTSTICTFCRSKFDFWFSANNNYRNNPNHSPWTKQFLMTLLSSRWTYLSRITYQTFILWVDTWNCFSKQYLIPLASVPSYSV